MKRLIFPVIYLPLLLAIAACSKGVYMDVPVAEPVTAYATYDDAEETRTVLSGLNIQWQEGDQVGLWDGKYLDPLTAKESGTTSSFTGTYYSSQTNNGNPQLPSGNYAFADTYYLCYPMPSAYSGGLFTVDIPVQQAVTDNSFAPGANVAAASTTPGNWDMTFSSATSYAKITVASNMTTLKRLALVADGISGTVKVDPSKKAISGKGDKNSVELKGKLKAGGKYYLTLAPGTHEVNLLGATKTGIIDKSVKLTFKKGQARWVADVSSKTVTTTIGGTFLDVDGEYTSDGGSTRSFKGVTPIAKLDFKIKTYSSGRKAFYEGETLLSYSNKIATFDHIYIEDTGNGRSVIFATVDGSDYRYYIYSTYVNLQILRLAPSNFDNWEGLFTGGNYLHQWEWYLFEQ